MNPSTITEAFGIAASGSPEALAVVHGESTMTYGSLDAISDRLARELRLLGAGPGCVVPVVAHRSTALVISLLGVLKAGASYAPVAEGDPVNRRRRIINQCGSPVFLSTRSDSSKFGGVGMHDVLELAERPGGPAGAFRPVAETEDAAYVIFTSGTTGTPKGVIVNHRAVVQLLSWHNERFEVTSASRATMMSGVGFDVLQWEIWSALCAGAALFVLDQATRISPEALLEFYAGKRITHAYVPTVLVPDVVGARQPAGLALRYLFSAGEKLPPVATGHLPYTLVDYYGPTEATIFATCRVVGPGSEHRPPSIGSPISDTEVFIVDDGLEPVPSGEAGELCLAGTCLARGYLEDPELTEQRFVHSSRLGRRVYRTGDLGRWLPDGTIQFLGRQDDQVKVRGYRIELGEIETAILGNRLVKHAVVLLDEDQDTPAAKRLAAFVVPREPAINPDGLVRALRAHVRDELPDYMQPGIYQCLPALPLTANGKIDRAALRGILDAQRGEPLTLARFDDDTERVIAEAWRSALGHGRFTADDSFFDVGGHSLLATALVDDISRRLASRVYIWDFYGDPTIGGLAAAIRKRTGHALAWEGEPVRELANDIYLPGDLSFSGGYSTRQLTGPRHILLTGTTGYVGVHLLERLLQTTEAVIHCPVRAVTSTLAEERLRRVVSRYELRITNWSRIRVYAGDLAEPLLGLPAGQYAALSQDVDVIYHSASAANFIQSYSFMRRDNVEGLRQLIHFAADTRVKPLMLVS